METPEFHIDHLIKLLKEQEPQRLDLVFHLEKLITKKWELQPYIQLVSDENANETGAEWQFDENIVLEDQQQGTIVLDVLKDGRIGGIEFLDLI
ncbi:hypothetical protein KMW28_03645 [Flammeovirga yaeyamensis]|uniref:DUF2283 domain-containing protein n=1 Tax=Flammeovirga yaeyamensis TaxID=367791 RepID=A0AAX1N5H4_9BACT|nr:hypothetical protein [Flammeovirga yaeyamensis]MBB3701259.1 hypothetical protein [Flammeovirga yaeyamensis]NMF38271.1 hypothetical protein [Flammeovirga yaeyamensis]QWG02682.1 hypothetical protein KMW28_03645 [Flammeovirga yaeyamensis]